MDRKPNNSWKRQQHQASKITFDARWERWQTAVSSESHPQKMSASFLCIHV